MYIFLRKTPLSAKKWGSPAVGRSQVGTAGIHTIGVPPDLLYFLASTSNTKRSSNSSISKERYNWRAKNRGRCGWQLQQSVYKRRDGARGPTLPRKQYAYIYRAAPRARTCIMPRLRTYTQPTQPSSCWSIACTHTTRQRVFSAAFCFMCFGE